MPPPPEVVAPRSAPPSTATKAATQASHWGDPDQPVFVHGGWMIPAIHQDALLATFPGLRARHRLNAPELKWQQLAKRDNGSAVFRDIFEAMLADAAVPFFHVMDKDYILAAKAVETFFDPEYNHILPVEFTSAYDVKKDLAEHFLLAPDALAAFANMLRAGVEPEPAHIEKLALQFADFIEGNKGPHSQRCSGTSARSRLPTSGANWAQMSGCGPRWGTRCSR